MKEILGRIFHWFYCLPMEQAAVLTLGGCWGFGLAERRFYGIRVWNWMKLAALMVWVGLIVYVTLGNRIGDSGLGMELIPFHSYRAVLAGENPELLRSNFMNVVLFVPLGLLFGSLLPLSRWKKLAAVVIAALLFSAALEALQVHFGLGIGEMDDVIHNTLGGLFGALFTEKNKTAA